MEAKGKKMREENRQRWEARKVKGIYEHERKKRQRVVAIEEYVGTKLEDMHREEDTGAGKKCSKKGGEKSLRRKRVSNYRKASYRRRV